MRKIILSLLTVFGLALAFTVNASAVNQNSGAEMYLGSYDLVTSTGHSNYCTATLTHMNLKVANSIDGPVQVIAQYRAPNSTWKDIGSVYKYVSKNTTGTINLNVTKGYDYRLEIKPYLLTASGFVTCD